MTNMHDVGEMEFCGVVFSLRLAQAERRTRFLEAALVQMLREGGQLREWFAAGELAHFKLPNLPRSTAGIAHMARKRRWETRIGMGKRAEQREYHYTSLPRPAFEGLVDLVLRALPAPAAAAAAAAASYPYTFAPLDSPASALTSNRDGAAIVAPWMLPLLRIMRADHDKTVEAAWSELCQRMGASAQCPSLDDVRAALRQHGLRAG